MKDHTHFHLSLIKLKCHEECPSQKFEKTLLIMVYLFLKISQ